MIRRLALAVLMAFSPASGKADDLPALGRALAAVAAKDWTVAVAEGRASGPLAADIVDWHRLRDGDAALAEYEAFLARRPDWPGLALLRKKGEAVLGGADPARVIAFFAPQEPQTGTGSLALAAALKATGAAEKAAAEVVRAWRGLSLTAAEHAAFLATYPDILKDHHAGRVVTLLAERRQSEARLMLPLVPAGTREIAAARIGLQEQDKGVDALIAAVPKSLAGSAGLATDRFIWRIRKDRYDDAAALMLERSGSAEALGNPDDWADWRRILARREMRLGDSARAYKLAAQHHLSAGPDYADLEWLAGYIALSKLGDAKTALKHFEAFRAAVASPISVSRAGYWQGRALESLERVDEARAAYAGAAQHQTAFYGQLAAEKLGLPLDPFLAGNDGFPDWRKAPFTTSAVFQAAVLLKAVGERDLATRFLLHLAEGLDGRDIGALAGLALEWGDDNMALLLAKAAAEKGTIWPRAYFPVTGLEKMTLPVPPELVLSIARRESEFNPVVISGAGARGLMQVMPGTAKLMAPEIGEKYQLSRLTTDPDYNAQLGAAYLAGLVAEFGPSPVLVAVGYNAGPGRSRRWIEELGDPRAAGVDVVDWIEHIPFRETQNYVMRVAESLAIYRARLGGKPEPLRLTEELKGR